MVEDDRDDHRQAGAAVDDALVPNSQHVAEQAQRHPLFAAALVLEEDVGERALAGEGHGVEQVGVLLAQILVDEATCLEGQGAEIHAGHQRRGQDAAQLLGGQIDLGEGGLEEGVVGGGGHGGAG